MAEDYDLDAAYEAYLARFHKRFGDKPTGTFVKFGRHMVHKLGRDEFLGRLEHYFKMHKACRNMLKSGATISDDLVLEYSEAAAWVAIEAPNLLEMFQGDVGDPDFMSQRSSREPPPE